MIIEKRMTIRLRHFGTMENLLGGIPYQWNYKDLISHGMVIRQI